MIIFILRRILMGWDVLDLLMRCFILSLIMMAFVSGLKSYASPFGVRRFDRIPLVPPSEALRINYVYLIVKNIFFTQKTFGSLGARAIETSGALRNPERILSDEDIP